MDTSLLTQAATLIRQADGIIISAGAGMGVDSGLPDFRSHNGFWRAFPPLESRNIQFEDIANAELFYQDPKLAWGFYGLRLQSYRRTIPHEGFNILKHWLNSKRHQGWVYTSNVDNQFQRAGFNPEHILECHGSLFFLQCREPCSSAIWPSEGYEPLVDESNCTLHGALPTCPHCGQIARPNILMFNDYAWVNSQQTKARHLSQWLQQPKNAVIIELGAGTTLPAIRYFSEHTAQHYCAKLIRINPTEYHVPTQLCIGLPGNALTTLQQLNGLLTA